LTTLAHLIGVRRCSVEIRRIRPLAWSDYFNIRRFGTNGCRGLPIGVGEGLRNPLHDAHEIATALRFLQHAPDRQRAREIASRIAREAEKTSLFQIHPDRSRYGLTPLHLCPRPDSIAAEAFSENDFSEHLDELTALQQDDGGWPIKWEAPGPGAEIEWRGRVTLDALITLRAYGRI
jgi:hypothetical protein